MGTSEDLSKTRPRFDESTAPAKKKSTSGLLVPKLLHRGPGPRDRLVERLGGGHEELRRRGRGEVVVGAGLGQHERVLDQRRLRGLDALQGLALAPRHGLLELGLFGLPLRAELRALRRGDGARALRFLPARRGGLGALRGGLGAIARGEAPRPGTLGRDRLRAPGRACA